jgi:hopene-associated glycosyltransferase HpnB
VVGLGVACVLAATAWLYLLVARGEFWRTRQRLPRNARTAAGASGGHGVAGWPAVVAVIPARNEAEMLPLTLPTLLDQDYQGTFRVIVVDDCSDDGTGEVAARLGGDKVRVVPGKPRPDGWVGKVWAMAQGLAEAQETAPEYLLFTDADIAWGNDALRNLVTAATNDDRDLVSQMALLRTSTAWERAIVPAFVYFFAQLYPFKKVNAPTSRTAAAAGGCMLIRASALADTGLEPIKGALIDDVAMGQLVNRQRQRIWLGLSTENGVTSVRPYDTLASLWQMVARSAYTQLRYNPLLLAGTVVGLLFLYALPPVGAIAGLVTGNALAAVAGLAGWALMSVTYLPMLALYRISRFRAPTLPLIALLYAAMTVDSARLYHAGRGGEWKGRTASQGLLLLSWQTHSGRKRRKQTISEVTSSRMCSPTPRWKATSSVCSSTRAA